MEAIQVNGGQALEQVTEAVQVAETTDRVSGAAQATEQVTGAVQVTETTDRVNGTATMATMDTMVVDAIHQQFLFQVSYGSLDQESQVY